MITTTRNALASFVLLTVLPAFAEAVDKWTASR
jgi:hypothetical protein